MRVKKKLCVRDEAVKNDRWLEQLSLMKAPVLKDVHTDRCVADPMYQLLLFPEEELPVYAPSSGALLYTTTFVDRLLEGIHGMLQKRYGESFQQEVLITRLFEVLLKREACDAPIKVFALLFLIKWEPSVCELMRELYDTESTNSVFEEKGVEQYNTLLKLLDHWVEQTINYPFSQFSIVQLVQNFLDACTREYIMGPFQ